MSIPEPRPDHAAEASATSIEAVFDRLEGKPSTEHPAPPVALDQVQRWSVLLEQVPAVHRARLIQELGKAIERGEIQAISLTEELTHTYLSKGSEKTLTVPDEAVWYTAQVRAWITHQIKESEYDLLAEESRIRVPFERLTAGELDFKRLVKMRQASAKQPGKKAPTASKPAPTRTKSAAPGTAKDKGKPTR